MLKLSDLAVRQDFALGALSVSPSRREIVGPAGEVHVEPLVMQVFLLLADAKGEVVTRKRIFDECWGGAEVGDYSLNRTVTMIRRVAAEAGPGAFEIENIPRTGYRMLVKGEPNVATSTATSKWRRPAMAAAGLTALLAVGAAAWLLDPGPHEPTAAVVASGGPSTELASGIKSAAMTTAATYQAALRLADGPAVNGPRADFLLRVQDDRMGNGRKINLSLVSNADKSLLWAWSKSQPEADANLLEQEAKLIGASVLTCAAETQDGAHAPDQETIKLYLDACSKFEPWAGADLKWLTNAFKQVTLRAPHMRGAWSKLLVSEGEAIEGLPPIDLKENLRKDLGSAVALGIDIPELYGARATLLPPNARFERLKLIEAGLARYPSSIALLGGRSWMLRSLGRMDEAARTAQHLAALYPQSSAANSEYANSLMSSGRADAARHVLERAAKVTPDAANLEASRWILEMRYGDPRVAMEMARSGGSVVEEPMVSFLEARINPTRANIDRAIDQLMGGYRKFPDEPGWVAQALATFGRKEEAIRFLLSVPNGDRSGDGAEMLFRPHMREIRRDRRFMQIAHNFGVTDYWIKSGILPDFCFDPGLPYDCKEELTKLRPLPSP